MAIEPTSHSRRLLRAFGLLNLALAIRRRTLGAYCAGLVRALARYGYNDILTHVPIHWLRLAYLRVVVRVQVGPGSFVHLSCRFEPEGEGIRIGQDTVIGRGCVLLGDILVGDSVSMTAGTYVFTTSHDVQSPDFAAVHATVRIGDRAWLGARAMVLPGVCIGEGGVLAAASTATRDIPAYRIYAGSPARDIGGRTEALSYTLDYRPFLQ